jgi:hypothetical protein
MPKIIGNLPADYWENEVLKALKNQLPNDWIVMPSVMWALEKNGYVRDGEADFVVLVPESGLVVIEVKGSKEFKVNEDGTWLRKDKYDVWNKLKEAPPAQATRNMHDLTATLNERYLWPVFPGRFSYLVIYPQGETSVLPAMFDQSTIATRRHMNQLESRIRHSLERRGGEERGEHFSWQVMESIIDILKNRKFHIKKVDDHENVDNDLRDIEQLTRQQFATLKGLFQMPNVAVIGPAGSGKTVLAIWRLKAIIEYGQSGIYVCYNRVLADSLRLRNPEIAGCIWSVDRLFVELLQGSVQMMGQANFYREILPGLVIDISETLKKYDAIIVDEGQDFSEDQIVALLDLLSNEATWAFFADWKQDLYSAGKGTPIGAEVVFHLHHNCRNTFKINDASNNYLNVRVESMPGMPLGVSPLIESTNSQSLRAWEIAKNWNGEGSIAILSPFKYENSAMQGQRSGHGLTLSNDISDLGKKDTVFFSTIKSFKGLEASTVIVVDVGIPDEHVAFSKEDLYVACTRATTRLALISTKKDIVSYYKDRSEL